MSMRAGALGTWWESVWGGEAGPVTIACPSGCSEDPQAKTGGLGNGWAQLVGSHGQEGQGFVELESSAAEASMGQG